MKNCFVHAFRASSGIFTAGAPVKIVVGQSDSPDVNSNVKARNTVRFRRSLCLSAKVIEEVQVDVARERYEQVWGIV